MSAEKVEDVVEVAESPGVDMNERWRAANPESQPPDGYFDPHSPVIDLETSPAVPSPPASSSPTLDREQLLQLLHVVAAKSKQVSLDVFMNAYIFIIVENSIFCFLVRYRIKSPFHGSTHPILIHLGTATNLQHLQIQWLNLTRRMHLRTKQRLRMWPPRGSQALNPKCSKNLCEKYFGIEIVLACMALKSMVKTCAI